MTCLCSWHQRCLKPDLSLNFSVTWANKFPHFPWADLVWVFYLLQSRVLIKTEMNRIMHFVHSGSLKTLFWAPAVGFQRSKRNCPFTKSCLIAKRRDDVRIGTRYRITSSSSNKDRSNFVCWMIYKRVEVTQKDRSMWKAEVGLSWRWANLGQCQVWHVFLLSQMGLGPKGWSWRQHWESWSSLRSTGKSDQFSYPFYALWWVDFGGLARCSRSQVSCSHCHPPAITVKKKCTKLNALLMSHEHYLELSQLTSLSVCCGPRTFLGGPSNVPLQATDPVFQELENQ